MTWLPFHCVHKFTKLEMIACCLPEDSGKRNEELRALEENIFAVLVPYCGFEVIMKK